MPKRYITTQWEWATYDVWGNAKDGYDVNDVYRHRTPVELRIPVTKYNVGTPHEFEAAFPTDTQIRSVLGCERVRIDHDGDDLMIYVNRSRDSYPLGEMRCVSHESLSPIRVKTEVAA